jgi:hypothetical protein
MTLSRRFAALRHWVFPLLVALLVLGHACELPAYTELIASADHAAPAGHDHEGDAQALSCDATLAVPALGTADLTPVVAMAVIAPVATAPAGTASLAIARPIRSFAGPPLFLLHSSLLI